MEQEAREAVRAHQGLARGAGHAGEEGEVHRGPDGEQGAGAEGRGEDVEPVVAPGSVAQPTGWPEQPQGTPGPDQGRALRGRQAPPHRGPVEDVQGPARPGRRRRRVPGSIAPELPSGPARFAPIEPVHGPSGIARNVVPPAVTLRGPTGTFRSGSATWGQECCSCWTRALRRSSAPRCRSTR